MTHEPLLDRYDAVVVGARCAGAATALLLARRGLRVLLVDRDRHGADTLSTLALMRAGVLQLHRWQLLDAVREAGAPPIRSTSFVYGDEEITVPIKLRDGVDALYAPRRTLLDPLLSDAAAAAGAHLVHGPRLVDLIQDSAGTVLGVVLEKRDGTFHRVHAGVVIGADGRQSHVARMVGAREYRQGRHRCGVVYGFWRGLENEGNRWYYRPGVSAGRIPTSGDDTCIFVATPPARFEQEVHSDMAAYHRRALAECAPALASRIANEAPSERLRGFPGRPGYLRQCHGPGWALVGDAGYFKDPITAHGITDALRDAELLARAVEAGTDQALVDYQEARDALSGELFDITETIASFDWTLESLKLLHKRLSRAMNEEVDALVRLDETVDSGLQPAPRSAEHEPPRG